MRDPVQVYQRLLKLYPASFREEYGSPMERQFRDDYRDARNRWQRAAVWFAALGDLIIGVPKQTANEFRMDVKHALRLYRHRWVTTVLAVLALGLAIGLSTGVFSVLNALLLRSLPFAKPEQLTELWLSPFTAFMGRAGFDQWSRSSPYLESAATFSSSEMNLAVGREGFRVKAAETSAGFFSVLGVEPMLGRTFAADEDESGRNSVAVVSFGLWQQLFAGNPGIPGTVLRLNGAPVTIVGVMPASFDYPAKTSIWLPTAFDFDKVPKRGAFLFQTIGRLRSGVNIRQASALFEAAVRRKEPDAVDEQNRPRLASLRDQLAGPVRRASWVLAGLTLLVLLTACANVAQLLLSRTLDRRKELELRSALGASRARLLQQLVTEALLLTTAGALLGILVAAWTAKITSLFAPPQLVTQNYSVFDWPVLAFAIALTLITALVFGALPAAVMRGSSSIRAKQVRMTLVGLQTGLALCLVTGSLCMGKTFLELLYADLGFRPQSAVTINVSLQGTKHTGAGEYAYYSEALNQLRGVPGVTAAGAVAYLPLATNVYMANSFDLDSGQKVSRVITNAVTPGYFRAMGTKFLAGTDFLDSARTGAESSVIVNETFARATGLGPSIIGRRVVAPWNQSTHVISGVVSTVSLNGPENPGEPQIYWPLQQEPPAALTLVAGVRGEPERLLLKCREAVRRIDPAVPIYDVETLGERLATTLARPRYYTTVTAFLSLFALLLAAMGSYGTAAYSIAQRTHEMGIRLAVGASYIRVRSMMLREGLLPILLGTVGGVVVSLLASRYLEYLLGNASRSAAWACVVGAVCLFVTGVYSIWSATNRILRIDPAASLRAE